jgi:hypothetical protein
MLSIIGSQTRPFFVGITAMPHFETFIARHGEIVAQAILENWERTVGIRHNDPVSLEDRWQAFIQEDVQPEFAAA